jgi:hypothetical protein
MSLLAAGLAMSAAEAQPLPYYARGPVVPSQVVVVPAAEVAAIVRSAGLVPLSPPFRHGLTYRLRAVEPAGYEVQVVVSAWSGRILRVHPALPAPELAGNALPAPYSRPPGLVAVPPEPDPLPSIGGDLPPPSETVTGAVVPRPPAATAPPPLPRPRPKVAAASALPSLVSPSRHDRAETPATPAMDASGSSTAAPAGASPPAVPDMEE